MFACNFKPVLHVSQANVTVQKHLFNKLILAAIDD